MFKLKESSDISFPRDVLQQPVREMVIELHVPSPPVRVGDKNERVNEISFLGPAVRRLILRFNASSTRYVFRVVRVSIR